MPGLIAIGGGIGSGKSVICRILRVLGYKIYDCDNHAKAIMDSSPEIISAIETDICPAAVATDATGRKIINRTALANAVFSNSSKLNALNALVHSAVRRDLTIWYTNAIQSQARVPLFVESAIIIESGLDKMASEIWEVTAPEDVRISRIITRDRLTVPQIRARIQSQQKDLQTAQMPVRTILNDGTTPLLPQIHALLTHY